MCRVCCRDALADEISGALTRLGFNSLAKTAFWTCPMLIIEITSCVAYSHEPSSDIETLSGDLATMFFVVIGFIGLFRTIPVRLSELLNCMELVAERP